jgi:hypothetical protein
MFARPHALKLRVIAFALVASVLFVLGLAANPRWHERVHQHGHEQTHEVCAVDLFASGSVDSATTATPLIVFAAIESTSLPMATVDVPSVFLTGSVLEHAPPARL